MSETQKPTPGSVDWNELITTDLDAACAFYGELFGWTWEDWPMEQGGVYKLAKQGGKMTAGLMAKTPQMPAEMPPFWGAYVTVENCDAAAEKAQSLGATILVPPMDIPKVGRFTTIQDPQGAVISMMQYQPCQDNCDCC